MKLYLSFRRLLARALHPYRAADRWLLGHRPMIWAERYHLALAAAVVLGIGAALLGASQGSSVAYSLAEGAHFLPIESGLPLVPWAVAAAWVWRRSRAYSLLPIVRVAHGFYYGIMDLAVLLLVMLIPVHYSWAFQAGLHMRLPHLAKVAEDEYKLKAAWNEWGRLLEARVPKDEMEDAMNRRSIYLNFRLPAPDWGKLPGTFGELSKWHVPREEYGYTSIEGTSQRYASREAYRVAALSAMGINHTALSTKDATGPPDNPEFKQELAKLEKILQPLCRDYMELDITPAFMAGAPLQPRKAEEVMALLGHDHVRWSEKAFDTLHDHVMRYEGFADVGFIKIQTWIAFGCLLSSLAIPAVTVGIYWSAWGFLMAGFILVTSIIEMFFSGWLGESGAAVLYYGVAGGAVVALLLALTNRKIGKHKWIKLLCVFVPIALLTVPLIYFDFSAIEKYSFHGVGFLLGVNAVSRVVFNRLRSLPDPN